MRILDISFALPEENLAFDEVLLNAVEDGEAEETLRFWESPSFFVVLGVAQAMTQEIDAASCFRDGVPIHRRCSAGGTVLQGPGCLNFSLALALEHHVAIQTIRSSYRYILGAIAAVFNVRGVPVRIEGISDLVLGGQKVSGNSQRRRRRSILHHGTLLYQLEVRAVARYLKEPTQRPAYRGLRVHEQFMGRLPLDAVALRQVVREALGADGYGDVPAVAELDAMRLLVEEKYRCKDWIRRR
jgi:lipoate---protein ligase